MEKNTFAIHQFMGYQYHSYMRSNEEHARIILGWTIIAELEEFH